MYGRVMMIGPTPPRDGGQNARNSMENNSLGSFIFGLLAVAVLIGVITAVVYFTVKARQTEATSLSIGLLWLGLSFEV